MVSGSPALGTVGVDGLTCLLPPPPPGDCVLQSSTAHVQGDAVGRVMKPFHAVPPLELPKDRPWACSSLFHWAQPGSRSWEGAQEMMDASSLLCYPYNGRQTSNHLVTANASGSCRDPSLLPAWVTGPTGGHNRELLVLIQIRKFYTGWYWFSFMDYSPQTE